MTGDQAYRAKFLLEQCRKASSGQRWNNRYYSRKQLLKDVSAITGTEYKVGQYQQPIADLEARVS